MKNILILIGFILIISSCKEKDKIDNFYYCHKQFQLCADTAFLMVKYSQMYQESHQDSLADYYNKECYRLKDSMNYWFKKEKESM